MVFGYGKKTEILPDMTIKHLWEKYTGNPSHKSDDFHLLIHESLKNFDLEIRQKILSDLVKIETDSDRQNDRLRYIRLKIMDLVDRRIAAKPPCQSAEHTRGETFRNKNTAGIRLERALQEYDLQIAMLRAYTREKYGDVCRDDWYAMYLYLAEFFNGHELKCQEGGFDERFIFQGKSMEPTRDNFQRCRSWCLEAYVGQQFEIPTDRSNRLAKLLRKIRRKSVWRKLVS